MKLRPIAACLISASPGPGSGVGTSSQTMTSGPPLVWMRIAFVMSCLHATRCSQQGLVRTLQRQQPAFGWQSVATGVAANVRYRNNPVAGDDHGNRVTAIGLSDGPRASAGAGRDILIASGLTVGDLAQRLPDLAAIGGSGGRE